MKHHANGLIVGISLFCVLVAGAAHAQEVPIVKDGRPHAHLVIDSRRYLLKQDLTNQWSTLERTIGNVASTVAEYVQKSTGASLPIVDLAAAPLPADGVLVYIGRGEYVDRAVGPELDKLDPSGYLIRVMDQRRLIIAGPTSEGTEFGTYEFLERFVGVRWLMPTPVGDYVPRQRGLAVPAETNVKDAPAFMQAPGLASKPSHQTWARRMRFWTRLNFHHNMVNLFPPHEYTRTHPEFYPILQAGGTQRYLPASDTEDWQPCFTAPGIVDEAAKNIIKYLDGHPRVRSYSFGVNDTDRYCQCANCRKEYIPGESFLGMPCYSDAYFKFVNAVVEKVLRVHSDVWFGCLGYSNIGRPPVRVRVHPRVIPFLTYDTMQLLDPVRRKIHEQSMAAWGAKCTFLGRYDYTYGDDHIPPRLYLHHWADYVRWARDHKVRAWYAETYPFFGEAPKYYVMAKIWWNPNRDVDALLDEWYRLAFGKAAAPMSAYFGHWEAYWTQRVPHTDYFRRCKNEQYLLGNPGFLEGLTTADIEKADAWIANAGQLADTPETKARVAVMARSWTYYRSIIGTYLRDKPGSRLSVDEALKQLAGDAARLVRPGNTLYKELMADPLLTFTWESAYPYGSAERAPFFDAAEIYLDTRDGRLAEKLSTLARVPNAELASLAKAILAIADGTSRNIVPNSGFEASNPLEGWWAGMHLGTGTVSVSDHKPFEGKHAVQIAGTFDGYGGVFRTDVPVRPGKRYMFVLRARSEGQPAKATTCQMTTQFRDTAGREAGNSLHGYSFRCAADWRSYIVDTRVAPPGAASMLVRVDALSQPKKGHRIYIDAMNVYEVPGADK